MKKITCIIVITLFVLSLAVSALAAPRGPLPPVLIPIMTDEQFVAYVRDILLKDVAITGVTLVPTNNAGVVAATAKETGYPGTNHLYIYSRILSAPGAAPTPILQKTFDDMQPLQGVTFDDTGNIFLVRQGSQYTSTGTLSIYGANSGSLITMINVTSMAADAVTIVDNPGSWITINIYSAGTMGTQLVLDVTSSGATIVSRNDHYLPANILNALPAAKSNANILIYVTASSGATVPTQTYNFFQKDGTYLVSIVKYMSVSSYGGVYLSSIGSPDASADSKYIAIAYNEKHNTTGSVAEQRLKIYDIKTGNITKDINLLLPTQDTVNSIKFAQGSSNLVEVTYSKAGTATYDITTGLLQKMTDDQFVQYIRGTLLKGVTITGITLVPTNNPNVVAATVQAGTGYDGMTYLYIYSRALSSPGAAPTQIFQKSCDSTHPLLISKFDDTGNIFIVSQGTMYANPHSSTVSIYGVNNGSLITAIDVPSMDSSAVSIVDNAGSRITISTYVENSMGTQLVLDVTSSGVTIVSRNDHYLPANILNALPATKSNANILIYVTASSGATAPSQTYNFFKKDGTYLVSATKSMTISSQGGFYISAIGSPDATSDGKYIAIAYEEQHYYTGRVMEQNVKIYDAQTGSVTKEIKLLLPTQDTVKSVKFAQGSSNLVEVTYANSGVAVYDITTGLLQKMTDDQFVQYIQGTLLKGVAITGITLVPTNNPNVVAATVQAGTGYDGMTYLYIYSRALSSPGAAPTQIFQKSCDSTHPLLISKFDDTGNIFIVSQGTMYANPHSSTVSIYGVNNGSLITAIDVPSMDSSAVSIVDNAGSRITISTYVENSMGTQLVLDVTSSGVTIVSRNDHYLPANILNALPATKSNANILIYVTASSGATAPSQTYNFFKKDGTYLVSATKSMTISSQGGFYISAIGSPDATSDGKYIAIAYEEQHYYTGRVMEQNVKIYDAQTGSVTKEIKLLLPTQDTVKSVKFAQGSSNLVEVTYANSGVAVYDITTGLLQKMTDDQFVQYIQGTLLKGVAITGITLVPTNNPNVVAATVQAGTGYDGMTYLYIYSRVLSAPGAAPTQIFQKSCDSTHPLLISKFDDTGNIFIVSQGTMYTNPQSSTLSIYGANSGSLVTTLNVPSMDSNAVTITDNPGSQVTISIYAANAMGTQVVLNATSSGATIVTRNDHYLPASVLTSLSATKSNANILIYVTASSGATVPTQTYNFFQKDGTYLVSIVKYMSVSSYGGVYLSSIGSPDATSDGKYIAIAYNEQHYTTGSVMEQRLKIYDIKTGNIIKDINLLLPTQDTVNSVKFAQGSSSLVEVTYSKAGTATYDITTGLLQSMTDALFVKYIQDTLLKGVAITGITPVPTNNPNVVAATVQAGTGYDGMTYLYIYSRALSSPGAAPTQIFQKSCDSTHPLLISKFDDTGNIFIVSQGTMYANPHSSTVSIYGVNNGSLITAIDVPSMDSSAVSIVDNAGSRITISTYVENSMGTQLVLDVTSSGATIVTRNDHYLPANILNALPATKSNANILIYVTKVSGTAQTQTYNFFTKDGTYIMSAAKESCVSSQGGWYLSGIGSPDASSDGKYMAIAYNEEHYYTGRVMEQRLKIYDIKTGNIIKDINLLLPTQDTVNSVKFAQGSSSLVEVTYSKAGTATYDITTGLLQSMTDALFVKYIQDTLLKGVAITGITLVPTNNPNVVAATVQAGTGYDGMTYLYIYSRALSSPGAAPTQIFQKSCDSTHPLLISKFDDTGNIFIVSQGTMYANPHSSTVSIYGVNNGSLITAIDVPSMDSSAVSIVDNAGSRITISTYVENSMGTQLVLDVTSSGATIVTRNDHYLPANILNALPATKSNANILIYVTKVSGTAQTQTYNFFTKDGTYIMSAAKESCVSSQGGWYLSGIGSPDASSDGKYMAIAYNEEHYYTGRVMEQRLKIYDIKTGNIIKDINLLLPTQDTVNSVKFAQGSSSLVEVTYSKAGTATYDITTGLLQSMTDALFVKYIQDTLLKGVAITGITPVPTNNPNVVAATVQAGTGYDGMTYLYIYSRALSSPGAAPTQIFQKSCDSTHPLLISKFDDTGNIFIVSQGTMYANPHSSTVSIYGVNNGSLITAIDVPSMDSSAVSIVDNAGSRITISTYVENSMGTQLVLDVTSSGATIVTRNDHYLPASVLTSLSATKSNTNILIYVTASSSSVPTQDYNFFQKDGTYLVSVVKYMSVSSYGGVYLSSIGSPDASADSKYIVVAYNEQHYTTGSVMEQRVKIYDIKTGNMTKDIKLLLPTQDTVKNIRFAQGSSSLVEVTYANSGVAVYDITTGLLQSMTDALFVKYIQDTLLKGVAITGITLVPTNNPNVVAATAQAGTGYDGMTYLYIYSRALSSPGAAPTQIFQKSCDSTHPLLISKFDDTGNIFIVSQGTMYANPHSSTVSIYGVNNGSLITAIDVPSMDSSAVSIVDNAGSRITISTYVENSMGTQLVLDVTSSGATIVTRNDHYLPANILNALPATKSNANILIYVTKVSGTAQTQTYNFFTKDGTYIMSAAKESCVSSQGGWYLSGIGSPDASSDGKYMAIAYNEEHYYTGRVMEQRLKIYDIKTGNIIKDINLLLPTQDTVNSVKFAQGSSSLVEVTYSKAGTATYDITTGLLQKMTDDQFAQYIRGTLLKGVAITGVTLVPTNNPNVVAATAQEPGYPGTTYLYIYSRALSTSDAAPTPILQQTYDVFKPLQSFTFDDTGNIAIIRQGSIYSSSGTLSIYGANNGSLVTTLNVPSMNSSAVTITDNPGSQVTISIYSANSVGTQVVLDVTSSGAAIVTRNDHYLPADVLNSLPITKSNTNILIYVTTSASGSALTQTYSFFTKDGTYLVSAAKSTNISSYGGVYISSIGSPDATLDGKYIAIAYNEQHYTTGSVMEQRVKIYDTQTGNVIKDINLLAPTQDTVKSIRFAQGSSNLIEVTYAKAGVTVYDIATGLPQSMTDALFVKYVQDTLLKGVAITGVTLVPTNNPNVVAATAQEPGYPGTTYLYIYSRALSTPDAAPTPILQQTYDVFKPLQSFTFDDTGNIAIIRQGSIYSSSGTLSIYGANNGSLVTTLNVPSMNSSAVTITDNPGSQVTISIYSANSVGTQVVLDVTSSGAAIVTRNDHYLPADILNSLPVTKSNTNILIYVTTSASGSALTQTYSFFTKDGTYLVSAAKSTNISSYGGVYISSIGSPDATLDGKYIAIAYNEQHYTTGSVMEQRVKIYDTQTGNVIKDINLLAPTQDTVKSIRFAQGSSNLIEVTYAKAGVTVYDIATGLPQSMTDALFVKYVQDTLLKGVAITGVTLVPTNNPNVVAATAQEPGYPGTTYLYIYSRALSTPDAAPTPILQQTYDVFKPLQSFTFDDTGNIAIIRQGSIYSSSGTLSIYGANNGSLVTTLNVPSMNSSAVTITDNPGSQVTISIYSANSVGTQVVLDVTSSGAAIVTRNDHYLPADVLNSLPVTKSNTNILIYVTTSASGSALTQTYSFFTKDGTYLVSAAKSTNISSYGGVYISSIGSPDATLDGKYIAIAYNEQHYTTGSVMEQRVKIYDTQTGNVIKDINLLAPTQDTVKSIKFADGSPDLIEVNYAKAGVTTYDVATGTQKNNNAQLDEVLQRLDVLAVKNKSLPENITSSPNMVGNESVASQMMQK